MDRKEKKFLTILDNAVHHETVLILLDNAAAEAESELENSTDSIMAWRSIPLDVYSTDLPEEVRSSWVFILRKNTVTGTERHPNSCQRMMSFRGKGDIQTKHGDEWKSHFLKNDLSLPVEERWISIPENVWHQAVTSEDNWVVVSFQTAPPEELIEERPAPGDENKFRRNKYLS